MGKNKVDITTLGCSKNLVDSGQLMCRFVANGYTVEYDPHKIDGEAVVMNICGSISDAQKESTNVILELDEQEQKGRAGKPFVMGCLSERSLEDLEREPPEVDRLYGKFNQEESISDLDRSYHQELAAERMPTTPRHYTCMEIGKRCNRTCSYCPIPITTKAYQSRPVDEVIDEVRGLVAQGVKEFQMIAQDLTFYGLSRYKRMALPGLMERVSDTLGVERVRLHYGYPSHFPYDLLLVTHGRGNVYKYMGIAFQHTNDPMLKMVCRNIIKAETYELLECMRREVPGIHLRTILMVGHPGETEQDFEGLIRSMKDIRSERMGAFAYSHEEGTCAYQHYKDEIPQEVKQDRLGYLMRVQEDISAGVSASKAGQTFQMIVDREGEDFYVGRTQYGSPKIDPEILIPRDTPLSSGSFYQAKIIDTQAFDLCGRVLN